MTATRLISGIFQYAVPSQPSRFGVIESLMILERGRSKIYNKYLG